MATNAQLPNYFRQFDVTGGQLLDGFVDQSNPAMNPLAAQTQSEIASTGQSELSQLQSQISDLISGSAGQASPAALPSSLASNSTPALTSTATLPAGLSTPATPGPTTTVITPGPVPEPHFPTKSFTTQPAVPGLGLSPSTGIGSAPATVPNPGSTTASPPWALGPNDLTMEQILAAHGGSVPSSGLQFQSDYSKNLPMRRRGQ